MKMENLLQSLSSSTGTASAGASNSVSTMAGNQETLQLTNSDLNPNMEDVMKVINDLDGDFNVSGAANENNTSNGNNEVSLVDVPQVADRTSMTDAKLKEVLAEQVKIERRYEQLRKRLDRFRCRQLGTFVCQEISRTRDYVKSVTPDQPPIAPNINPFNLIHTPPINMPDGIVLPSHPSSDVVRVTTPANPSSISGQNVSVIKVKEENGEETKEQMSKPLTDLEKVKIEEGLGQLQSHLKHLIQSQDSEATESSSGGESCDEMDNFPPENTHYVPLKKRAKYTWLSNRAKTASKWTWLTAQISDLEYRIRQQTEFYRQIRAAKGAVTVGEPVISWPPHAKKPVQGTYRPDSDVPMNCKPVTKDYSRVDSLGRKIIIKEPSYPLGQRDQQQQQQQQQFGDESVDDGSFGACRTKPVKMIRRRRIIPTQNIFKLSTRAAKESTVKCDCVLPNYWCSVCFGRSIHTQVPEPIVQERRQCVSLLDHSYHQVLSSKSDMPIQMHLMEKIKDRSWLSTPTTIPSPVVKDASLEMLSEIKLKKTKIEDEEEELLPASGKKNKKVVKRKDKDGKLLKKMKKLEHKRRKSLNVHHYGDDRSSAMLDLSSDGDTISGIDGHSPIQSPSVGSNNQAWMDHFRRKRETAFDIDNIVIPYSIAAATRVEKLKYKEILTPTWRKVADVEEETTKAAEKEKLDDEDISVANYESRHWKAELEEQKRWQLPLWKTSGGQRSRSRRQDSCRTEASSGCNTPDPLSPGMVETLEVTTRPSTPVNVGAEDSIPATPTSTQQAASIRNRRRTSSATKSRDRNPSEDQSSRCASPSSEQQQQQQPIQMDYVERLPFDTRSFPLSEEEFEAMIEDTPDVSDVVPVLVGQDEFNAGDELRVGASGDDGGMEHENVLNKSSSSPQRVTGAFSPCSTEEEDTEEDPDWNGDLEEDPEDPEWNEETSDSAITNKSAAAASGMAYKKGHGLSLKIPKHHQAN